MPRIIYLLTALAMLTAPASFARAQERAEAPPLSAIAAIVNDEVISTRDIQERMTLVFATTQLPDTEETRARLAPQLLRALVDETLQRQDAEKNGVQVTDADVAQGIRTLEEQRGMPDGALIATLESRGVPREIFLKQLRAQISWNKLILKNVRPRVSVSEEEIDRERSKLKSAAGSNTDDVKLALLTLPVERPENDMQVRALAERLASGIRGGAEFENVARELKAAGGAAQSSEPFWIGLTDADPALAKAVTQLKDGEVSPPVRTSEGYTLAKLLARRKSSTATSSDISEIVVKDVLLKLSANAGTQDVEPILVIAREVAKHPGTCSDPGIAGVNELEGMDIEVQFRREVQESLPDALRDVVSKLPVGGVSEPLASPDGVRFFMLCERVEKPAPLADREEAMNRLYRQKMELEAQKYLRNLRRDASVDVRLR